MQLKTEILKTLLYYDIWSYPLNAKELFTFLPVNSMTLEQFTEKLHSQSLSDIIQEHSGFYYVNGKSSDVVGERQHRHRHAKRMWVMARLSMHVIKRFPFVRSILVSGDLSKNATHSKSDIDFFVITAPNRLWITRSLLILFKKIFLLNSKKFFCLNYFATTENLTLDDQNIFVATEVATLKPLFRVELFHRYLEANSWIKKYFPNFDTRLLSLPETNERPSILQKLFELPFLFVNATALDELLMRQMERVWAKRYPHVDATTRKEIFRCTRCESRAYVGNFQDKILSQYHARLKQFGVVN